MAMLVWGLVLGAGLVFLPCPAAALEPMAESEMDEITGQYGFSEIKITGEGGAENRAEVRLNIDAEIFAEIDHFGVNFDDGDLSNPADQSWYGVRLGREADEDAPGVPAERENLVLKEFYFEAEFENNVGTPGNLLLGMRMGFNSVTGRISADATRIGEVGGFDYFSGYYAEPRQEQYRQNLGAGYFDFDDTHAHMVFDAGQARAFDGDPYPAAFPPGVYMDFGRAEFSSY